MFLQNKYTNLYYKIITHALTNVKEGYTEKHHIIPRSLGGSNCKENIATMSAKQHFICHRLLLKMTDGENRIKMLRAFVMMSGNKRYTSKIYSKLKEEYANIRSTSMKGNKNIMYKASRSGNNNPMYGKNHSQDVKNKISSKLKGRPATQKGETSYWYGTTGIFNQMSIEWQDEQRTRSSKLRNSEIHYCSSCNRNIKTNANWFKHLRVKHFYTEDMILEVKNQLKS